MSLELIAVRHYPGKRLISDPQIIEHQRDALRRIVDTARRMRA